MTELQMVYIEWVDSRGGGHWFDTDDYQGRVSVIQTVGIVMAESKESITVTSAQTIQGDPDSQSYAPMTIPKVAITKCRYLSLGKKKRLSDA